MSGRMDIRKHWIFRLEEDDEIIEGLGSYMIVSKSASLYPPTLQPSYGDMGSQVLDGFDVNLMEKELEPGNCSEGKSDCS